MSIRKITTLTILTVAVSLSHVVAASALGVLAGSPFGHGAEGNFVGGIAVDPITGDVYQAERETNRVVKYDESGNFILMFGKEVDETEHDRIGLEPGETIQEKEAKENVCTLASGDTCKAGVAGLGAGELDYPTGVAVDFNTSDVYVNGAGGLGHEDNRVERFSSSGGYVSQIVGGQNGAPEFAIDISANGLAVDGDGDLYIASSGQGKAENGVLKFNPTGEYTGESFIVGTGGQENVAVDANGFVYVSGEHSGKHAVFKFAPNGIEVGQLFCRNLTLPGLAVNPFTDEVFVTGSEGFSKYEEAESYVCRYDAAGNKLEEFKAAQGKQPLEEIAYGASAGRLYEALNTGVWMYGTFPLPTQGAPTISREDWSNAGLTAMTLSARVNPHSVDTHYFFEYSTSPDLSGASDVPVPPGGDAGSSFLPVSVSVGLTGLSQSTTYYYRMVAHNAFGGGSTVDGSIQSFTTLAPLPSAATEAATEVANNAASVHGTVIPGSSGAASETFWCFQYGTTDRPGYDLGFLPGALAGDAGQGMDGVGVGVRLTRLQPETTYRYRLIVVNSLGSRLPSIACGSEGGHETDGAEGTFTTTGSGPGPLAVSGPLGALSQSAASLTGMVDPQGTSTVYDFQLGTDSSYGVDLFGPAGAGSESEPVGVTVSSLQPGTTYHYRLVASSRFGTSYGADMSFTTPGFPSAVLLAPLAPPLIVTPSFVFPGEVAGGATTKKTTARCRRGWKLSHGRCVKSKTKQRAKKASRSRKER